MSKQVESKFEKAIGTLGKVLAVASVLLIINCLYVRLSHRGNTDNDIVASSAMITNMAGTSGGTGVILSSGNTESKILTNAHVCRVAENGGIVSANGQSFLAISFRKSLLHDLCVITVGGNFGVNTRVADRGPAAYREQAQISGHPALYPNVVTTGYFSGRKNIPIMVGVRPCGEDDWHSDAGALCFFAGGIPVVRMYDSRLVTATIMPGSSGSGVYNSENKLSGLVFAGRGDLGYAWTVPYEFVRNFVDKEQYTLESVSANKEMDQSQLLNTSQRKLPSEGEIIHRLREKCRTDERSKYAVICEAVENDNTWYNQ